MISRGAEVNSLKFALKRNLNTIPYSNPIFSISVVRLIRFLLRLTKTSPTVFKKKNEGKIYFRRFHVVSLKFLRKRKAFIEYIPSRHFPAQS